MNRKEWAEAVKARDGGLCVICGAPGVNAHHVLSEVLFPGVAHDVDNGVTLCRLCHRWAHRGVFQNIPKRKHPASVAIDRLMERAASPGVRPIVERLVYADGENIRAAQKWPEKE